MQRAASGHGKSCRAWKRKKHELPYKFHHAGGIHDSVAVQGPLGSGELLQVAEAEPGDRIVHGDLQERRGNTDLRFHDIHAPVERTQEGFGQQTEGSRPRAVRILQLRHVAQAKPVPSHAA